GGHLDPGGVVHLRVPRGARAPRAQVLDVVELEAETAEVELDVLQQARVAVREHEPVPAEPVLVGGVGVHHVLIQQVGRRGEADRRAGMAAADVLDRVGGQGLGHGHGLDVDLGPLEGGDLGCGDVHGTYFLAAYGVSG